MARPLKQIDPKQVELLAGCGCTMEEMAAKLDCHIDTLRDRFSNAIEKGRSVGRLSLRGKQFEKAMKGSDTMLIWLGKQLLGQKDRLNVTLDSYTDEELIEEAKRRLAVRAEATAEAQRPTDHT